MTMKSVLKKLVTLVVDHHRKSMDTRIKHRKLRYDAMVGNL